MPAFVDPLQNKYGSTEITFLTSGGSPALQNVDITLTGKTLTGGNVTGSTVYGVKMTSDVGQTVSFPTTASAAINNYGVVVVGSSTAAQGFDLPMPSVVGQTLIVYAGYNAPMTSNCAVTLTATAANLIDGKYISILMQPYNWVKLVGISTTLGWAIVGQNTTTIGQSTSLITLAS